MEQGFWMYLIAQMAAAGPLSERLDLVGPRKLALMAGLFFSLVAAFFLLLLSYGGIAGEGARNALKWMVLLPTGASLLATSVAMVLPRAMSKR